MLSLFSYDKIRITLADIKESKIVDNGVIIEGLVTDLVYHNEENGYTVCEVELEEEKIIAVGILPGLHPGENIKAIGEWKIHPTYGDQFSIDSYEKTTPKTVQSIEKYLASGVIKGIGPALAKRIVQKFKEETLNVIEQQPEKLEEVKGVSLTKAQQIGEVFHEQRELRQVVIFLQDYGITPAYAMKIYKKYREQSIELIKVNPYRLADDIHGIGFKKADHIAKSMGIEPGSHHRIKAAIKYILSQASVNGDTYQPEELLKNKVEGLLEIEIELIENALLELQMAKQIYCETRQNVKRVYLMSFYYAEINIAKKLLELVDLQDDIDIKEAEKLIDQIEKNNGVSLANNQREAVREAMNNGVLVITGGPGTGKTTTINSIISMLEMQDNDILLAAPTGRAAKRMTEATGREALTIHRLLEINAFSESGNSQMFNRNEENPLEADVIVVDEVSMVDTMLMNSLLKAIVPGTRLLLVGDVDQLPSVGPGNVLKDIIASEGIPVVRLNEIFRQAGESAIIINAHRINTGEYPELNIKDKDFFFMKRSVQEEVIGTIIQLIKTRLPKFAKCSSLEDIQVLTPMRKSPLGVERLNEALQEALNPPHKNKKEKEFRHVLLREGDKVMQIKNNYNISWKIYNKYDYPIDEGVGIFNGDVGRVKEINERLEKVTVQFDDKKVVEYDYGNMDELELAYAITIHKSQGSEHPIVILPIHSGPPMLMSRNLLYTAVTRAKRYVVIVGLEDTVKRMVDNRREFNRYASLNDRIKDMNELHQMTLK